MEENDEKTPRGFLYCWDNEEETPMVKRIPCEVYSRIVGYIRPTRQWNVGKKQEFAERRAYVLPEVIPEVIE